MTQNPLSLYYQQFANRILPGTKLQPQEIEYIALCIGFPRNNQRFVESYSDLSAMEIITIRQTIIEILRLDEMLKSSINNQQVSKVEDIVLNLNYSGEIKDQLAEHVKRLARLLRLPILDNLYVSGDDVEGRLNFDGTVQYNDRDYGASYLTAYMTR